jgi:hypothetical protein
MEVPALTSSLTATRSPKVLIPYDVREAISVASAARNAGKSETTIRSSLKSIEAVHRKREEATLYVEHNPERVRSITDFSYIVRSI